MARPEKIRLGDLLIQQKLISQEQLEFALGEQKRNGRKLGRVLVDNGYITEEQISESLAKQLHIPYINLKYYNLNLELLRRLPENQARRFRALPLEERSGVLLIGMADPTDLLAFDELGHTLKRSLDIAVVTEGQLLETIDRVYRRSEEISGLAREMPGKSGENDVDFGELTGAVGVEEVPVINLLQTVFNEAVQARASGIHIESQENRLPIRFRVDGMLHLKTEADIKIAPALLLRLKLMSGMDAAEKLLPQDGRFNVRVRDQVVDVHISILPTQHGESVVMRLLNQGGNFLGLDKLGMPPEMLKRFREIIRRNGGMVLVNGPTGSGKTTTLYAALAEANAPELKVITVEDPVEYRLPGINQVQVNEKIGLTFARVLRSVLRQDPDIILAGEMRDPETAEIALRAAMTGHLVFSTLPTSGAAGALLHLMDMGVPKYMVASSVQAVLAQYLLRRVCQSCCEPYVPTAQETAWLKHQGVTPENWGKLQRGRGCPHCNGTGYSGRLAVYEMLEMGGELAEAVVYNEASRFKQAAQAQMQGRTLLDRALALMVQGGTTVAEVMHVGNQLED